MGESSPDKSSKEVVGGDTLIGGRNTLEVFTQGGEGLVGVQGPRPPSNSATRLPDLAGQETLL